ncbi:hypothetical protein PISMIDRAFT_672627 [Pisolithus microcarpus 441]|uniref:Uncharacterized protein n=1 Tax=Pisolithus microcarpus 441 TaxID=765257 RepID=A0A0C9YVU3_9AGAM|nr:hypothetical protein PISMIDRAFT_672627 [Pisolithus microcarpus 441]
MSFQSRRLSELHRYTRYASSGVRQATRRGTRVLMVHGIDTQQLQWKNSLTETQACVKL